MSHQVLARKWRPRNFHEVMGQAHVVKALVNGLDHDRLHHAFLFTGTRGVGKTTLARIFAKSLNCETGVTSNPCGICSICKEVDEGRFVDLIEVDAASRTKVEDTREILDNIQYAPTRGRYKVYLIDEVHMLSNSSFNALLKTLEEPPAHVKFLLATTDPQKLPVTVLSRCLRFHLKKLTIDEISTQLIKLLKAEAIPYEDDAIKLLAKGGEGSMRDALSLLDQAIAFADSHIDRATIAQMLGTVDDQHVLHILHALSTGQGANVLRTIDALSQFSPDFAALLEGLIDAFHQLALWQIDPLLITGDLTDDQRQNWQMLAQTITAADVQLFYQIALHGRRDLPLDPNPRAGFEMCLLKMCYFRPVISTASTVPATTRALESISKPSTLISAALDSGIDSASAVAHSVTAHSEISGAADIVATISTSDNTTQPIDITKQTPPKGDNLALAEVPVTTSESPTLDAMSTVSENNPTPLLPLTPENWAQIAASLALSALAQELAQNCVLESIDDASLSFALPVEFASLKNGRTEAQLYAAIAKYTNTPIALHIHIVGEPELVRSTPAQIKRDAADQKLAQAREQLLADPLVITLQTQFNAQLIEDSVRLSE